MSNSYIILQRKFIYKYKKCQRRSRYLMKRKRNGKFFTQQRELFKKFNARRQRGGRITYGWLRSKMRFICKEQQSEGFDEAKNKFTNRWCRAYCKRWKISCQRKTNKKSKSAIERIHLVSNFLYYIIYLVAQSFGSAED